MHFPSQFNLANINKCNYKITVSNYRRVLAFICILFAFAFVRDNSCRHCGYERYVGKCKSFKHLLQVNNPLIGDLWEHGLVEFYLCPLVMKLKVTFTAFSKWTRRPRNQRYYIYCSHHLSCHWLKVYS